MNAGVNINNLVASKIPNNLVQNNQIVKMDKGVFLKMMTQMINNNQNNIPNMSNEEDSDLNIMDILSGNTLTKLNSSSADSLVLGEEVVLHNSDNEDTKIQTKNDIENFISAINYFNLNNKMVNFEKLDVDNNSSFTDENNIPMRLNESQSTDTPRYGMDKMINVEKSNHTKLSVQAEKLISEIEGNRENFKKEIDYNIQLLSNKPVVLSENEIITITDESSEIRSQVMTQVKDKIVFMAEEGPSSGNIKQVTMELQPHNLGKVDIKMIFEDNKITVEIKALNEETQKILSTNIDELTKALSKTTDSSINVIVKSNESLFEHHMSQYENNEQRFNDNYDQENNGHNKQRYYYTTESTENDTDDDSIFSQLINLRNLQLQ